jgi:hypothetical protein
MVLDIANAAICAMLLSCGFASSLIAFDIIVQSRRR